MSQAEGSTSRALTPAARQAAVATARVLSDVREARERQVQVKGYDARRDDAYEDHELERAAAAYALAIVHPQGRLWPWNPGFWRPRGHRENLVRAAALLVAAIEAIDRAEA